VMRTAQTEPGARVAVIGCGAVGLSAVQGARLSGAAEIHAVDVEKSKAEAALKFGATDTETGDDLDYVFDAVGVPATFELALSLLGHGGTYVAIGIPPSHATASIDLQQLFDKRIRVLVSHGGDHLASEDFPQLTESAIKGDIDLASLVTKRIRLEDVDQAFDDMRAGRVVRSVVVNP
jgi:Zn-dependent alcohol dehydrogenase